MGIKSTNRQIELISRPSGMVSLSNFSIRESSTPIPKEGDVLVRTLYLSVDTYMLGRLRYTRSYITVF